MTPSRVVEYLVKIGVPSMEAIRIVQTQYMIWDWKTMNEAILERRISHETGI